MRLSMVDLIPGDARIEESDISHLFYWVCTQQEYPERALAMFQRAMKDVLEEEFGINYSEVIK